MCECSICLNPVRYTRKSKQLECGHLYHGTCIEHWLSTGGNTCPMCRSEVNKPTFKVTITIENTDTSRVIRDEIIDEEVIRMLLSRFSISRNATSELVISANDLEELEHIISDFGINFNTSILDAH
jgi:hypothetical protein